MGVRQKTKTYDRDVIYKKDGDERGQRNKIHKTKDAKEIKKQRMTSKPENRQAEVKKSNV
jgi:hypothetical protein